MIKGDYMQTSSSIFTNHKCAFKIHSLSLIFHIASFAFFWLNSPIKIKSSLAVI